MNEIPDFLKTEKELSDRRKELITNSSIYSKFQQHKVLIILIAGIIIVGGLFIASKVHKYNRINSLYDSAVEYQRKKDYDMALFTLDELLGIDKDNKKAKELYPELEEKSHQQSLKNSFNSAESYKDEGKYIDAYNCAKSAYSLADEYEYSDEKAKAKQLINELLPLKQQQEAEQAAKAEEEKKASEKAKAEKEAKEKADAEKKALEEAQAKAESQKKSTTSTSSLDKTFYGDGYTIKYPSTYEIIDYELMDFMVVDPDSGSNVCVVITDGDIQEFTKQDLREELKEALGDIFDINQIKEGKTADGYKYYEIKAETFDDSLNRTYITGDGNYIYFLTSNMDKHTTTDNTNIINDMFSSFTLSD